MLKLGISTSALSLACTNKELAEKTPLIRAGFFCAAEMLQIFGAAYG
jgi:hypothetical protein